MIFKYLPFLIILIFTFPINGISASEKEIGNTGSENGNLKLNFQPDSINEITSVESFVFQEFNYYAPLSGKVFLAWYPENYSPEDATSWNPDTKFTHNLLYTPIPMHGDTFSIQLKVPKGTILQYNFWITKNKEGHYQDFWDLQSSGKTVVTGENPINKNAVYSKAETAETKSIIDMGWMILILLIILYGLVYWLSGALGKNIENPALIRKIFFTGIGLAIFHAIARSEIIGINQLKIILHPGLSARVLKAGVDDFFFVICLVTLFMVIVRFVKKEKIRKVFFVIFIVLALISTLIAFTNITTVLYLGKPFNYQWLYYSDFLGSEEAKTALSANLSWKTGFNLLSLCISMLLLSGILIRIDNMLELRKKVKYLAYSILILACLVIGIKSAKTSTNWTKGQSENAITCMISSIITINSSSSFFTAEIPDGVAPFDPAQGTASENPVEIPEVHDVKNVLFIILESAGAVYFDAYGGSYNLSPNLNRYASQAVMFDHAYAHAPATNRSLVSFLGSIYPYISYKSITQEAPGFEHPGLSSILKNRGYRTSFFSSADLSFQNCREFLSYRDFDRVEDFLTINCVEEFQLDGSDYKEGGGIDDMCLAECLINWVDEDTTGNFFSVIWTVQGHYPYFFSGIEEDFGVDDYNFNRYLNTLKHNDELVGRIMQELELRGLDKTTLVVVVGDHGEAFGQHKQYGHGTALYEENLKVPLYFINPTLFHGQRKNDIAGMKDLASTALSVIGVDIPDGWQGRNLLNTDSDETFYFAPWSDYLFGYRKGKMKFIFNETRNKTEVFDLSTDPGEKNNLIDSVAKEDLENARNRVSAWVQHQDKFISQKLKEK
jgi:phosphoglycerol transferase MdoB-like AlkP superfamily enzyme